MATLMPGLLCHQWHGDGFTLYTLYNPRADAVSGDLLRLDATRDEVAHDAWEGREAIASRSGNGMVLKGTINAQRCGCFVVLSHQPK